MTSPNYYLATPMGVTDSGEVVLQANVPPNVQYYHTYVYTGGSAGTLGEITSLFSSSTKAISVNQAGEMVISANGTGVGGWFYSGGLNGTPTHLTSPTMPGGYGISCATGIDSAGEVVGAAGLSNGFYSPCVIVGTAGGGSAYDLPVPNIAASRQYGGSAIAISPNGAYIAGSWEYTPGSIVPPVACAAYWTPSGGWWGGGATITDISAPAGAVGRPMSHRWRSP